MNIFALDENPIFAARYSVNAHVIKMILETHTLLKSAHGDKGWRFHPCAKWTRESIENYRWLVALGLELCKEYTYRYEKIHKFQEKLEWLKNNEPELPAVPRTKFSLAMPDNCKDVDPVVAYRRYYNECKQHLAKWKKREKPNWFILRAKN